MRARELVVLIACAWSNACVSGSPIADGGTDGATDAQQCTPGIKSCPPAPADAGFCYSTANHYVFGSVGDAALPNGCEVVAQCPNENDSGLLGVDCVCQGLIDGGGWECAL